LRNRVLKVSARARTLDVVPSTPPDGEPAPFDGSLPAPALETVADAPFGFYVHVPFCRVRCGYCDFNTYTPAEIGGERGPLASEWVAAAQSEVRLARRVLGDRDVAVSTVFFGGGTPTMLAPAQLIAVLDTIRDEFGITVDAEITTEANPDSVDASELSHLRASGINRLSLGLQSAVPHVLATLDRTHDPRRLPRVVADARAAGFGSVSVDLIYGTPGESLDDWTTTLNAALDLAPDHVSAYSLIVEDGTALARRIRRGEVGMPNDDDQADKYELADVRFAAAGLHWYELSNWATSDEHRCRHNLLYWTGANWWGVGPGAHSHVGGVRWWNVKHPRAYAGRLADGQSPAYAREVLDEMTRLDERVLLESRLVAGLPYELVEASRYTVLDELVSDGLVEPLDEQRRIRLTVRGRLLADSVVHALVAP
jgi:putative oxygen-independent coproporphyrinogen III oxidase